MIDPCDDPYKILALNLVASCSDLELHRLLHDAKAIKRHITREVNDADFYGPFLDCIMVGVIHANERRKIGSTLHDTANFFYKRLDINRLRREIRSYCEEFNRGIE